MEGFEPPARSDRATVFKTAALNQLSHIPKRGAGGIRTHLNHRYRIYSPARLTISAAAPKRIVHDSNVRNTEFTAFDALAMRCYKPLSQLSKAGRSRKNRKKQNTPDYKNPTVERNGNEKGTPTRSGQYRKRDSNPHYNDFESLASTNWATPAHTRQESNPHQWVWSPLFYH